VIVVVVDTSRRAPSWSIMGACLSICESTPDAPVNIIADPEVRTRANEMEWIGLDWIGLDWIGLVWIGMARDDEDEDDEDDDDDDDDDDTRDAYDG
jgi:hypothetical protein